MTSHYELHVLHTPHDVTAATQAGLPDTSGSSSCDNCGDTLVRLSFVPRAVVLTENEEHILCLNCIQPVVRPRELQ